MLLTEALLSDKLLIPPLHHTVPRPRLFAALSRAREARLTLVSAPAGFGKTVLVADWIRSKNIAAAWLTLDGADNDIGRFLSYFAGAVRKFVPGAEGAVRHFFEGRPSIDPEAAMTLVLHEAGHAAQEFVAVLDDYHVITEPAVHAIVGFLINRLPPRMRIVVIGREIPPFSLGRLRASGDLVEIHSAQLRFSRAEAGSFLSSFSGIHLTSRDIAALHRRTEGWIAGLRLAVNSLRHCRDHSSFVREFSSSSRNVLDYLNEEVFRGLSPELESFLIRTSILELLCGPLCDAVTGRVDSQSILTKMESANIFIDALDENHNWYRYHSLFAGVLRRRLPAREAVELHERASEWMAAHGRQEYAIRHAREAGNFARGADLAQDLAEKALNRCEAATVLSWTDSLSPAERRARPLVCVFRAFAMLDLGMPLAGVRQLLRDATIGDVAKGFQAEIDAARCYLAFLADKPAESLSLAHRALSRETSKRTLARSVAETILGILSDSTGDINVARRVYMHSLQNARRAGNDYISIVVIWRLARIAVMSGALSRAARLCADAVELAEARRQRPLPVAAFPLLLQAEVHVERGNLVEAEQAIAQARPLAAQWTVDAMLEYARVTSVIYRASGNLRAALRAARRGVDLGLRKDVRESELRPIEANVAELSIAVGDIEEAETWAEDRRLSLRARSSKGKSHARDSNAFEAETLALARLLLARSRPEEALSATRLLLANSRRRGTIRTTIKALVIKTLALDAMGHTEKALGITSELLAMGEPEGFIQSLVDGGHVMHRLLREASSKGVRKLYAERILAAFPVSGRSRRPPPHESCALLLSSREVEIMLLLSKGFSNKEIAERAFLALQTVKWHTSNIYSKLGVKNRIQAVARARARGIIPRY